MVVEAVVGGVLVPVAGCSLFVRTWGPPGADRTAILIHGGPGCSHRYLEGLAPLADGTRQVVAYDQRGCGRSPFESDDPADYDLDAQAADLLAVIERTAISPVDVLGHSWGGIVAMDFASRYPERVRSVVLVGSVGPTAATLAASGAAMGARVAELQGLGLIPAELPEDATLRLRAILPMYLLDPEMAVPPEEVARIEVFPRASALTSEVFPSYDLTPGLPAYRGPVLIAHGRGDPLGLAGVEAARDALTGARVRFEVLEDSGHFPWLEAPASFFPLVRSFLEAS